MLAGGDHGQELHVRKNRISKSGPRAKASAERIFLGDIRVGGGRPYQGAEEREDHMGVGVSMAMWMRIAVC